MVNIPRTLESETIDFRTCGEEGGGRGAFFTLIFLWKNVWLFAKFIAFFKLSEAQNTQDNEQHWSDLLAANLHSQKTSRSIQRLHHGEYAVNQDVNEDGEKGDDDVDNEDHHDDDDGHSGDDVDIRDRNWKDIDEDDSPSRLAERRNNDGEDYTLFTL